MDLITQIYSSIFRVRAYQYFKEQSFGRAFLYLVVIVLLFSSISLVQAGLGFSRAIDQMIAVYQIKAPEFLLENGELNVTGKMPLVIFQDQRSIFIIDTSGQIDEGILADFEQGCLITKKSVLIRNRLQVRQFFFKDYKQLFFNKEKLARILPRLKWLMVLIFIIGWAGILAAKLFSALIVAALGLILAAWQRASLKFKDLYKLSIYALTLPIIIQSALQAGAFYLSGFFLLYYGIALVYLGLGIKQIKTTAPEEIKIPQ